MFHHIKALLNVVPSVRLHYDHGKFFTTLVMAIKSTQPGNKQRAIFNQEGLCQQSLSTKSDSELGIIVKKEILTKKV